MALETEAWSHLSLGGSKVWKEEDGLGMIFFPLFFFLFPLCTGSTCNFPQ